MLAPEPGARGQAFADGLAPTLAAGLRGRVAAALTAERSPFYLTILYALLLYRRDHELEPLHEDLLARVQGPASLHGAYDPNLFAQDAGQLVAWGALDCITEAHKLRSYKDNRRERFRYRLTDDAVALLEWLEVRLAARLAGRVGDGRDRLTDVSGQLKELRRVLDGWRAGERDDDRARRALYLVEAIGDAIDEVGTELVGLRAEMLGFASRPYDLGSLREILGWLERYVQVYVRRVEELRADIAARMSELGTPRFRDALGACRAAVVQERAATPRALRELGAVAAPSERLAAHAGFFAHGGPLARMAALVDGSARAVVVKMQRHVRELERRSHRLADLRAAITMIARGRRLDPRRVDFVAGLVASAQLRVDARPATAAGRMAPPLPRSHARVRNGVAAPALVRKRGSIEAVRELSARRAAALAAWVEAALTTEAGPRDEVAIAQLAVGRLADAAGPRRWLDLARAWHLGGGRGLVAAGARLRLDDGVVVIGDGEVGLAAPAGWLIREGET